METACKEEAYNEVLAFLDNLPEEQPSEDLEKEVESYFNGYWPGTKTPEQCNTSLTFTPLAILRLANHFVQWQKERMKPIRVVAEDVWGLPDGRVFAGKLRIVDDGCGDAIVVPGFNEEFTLYKENEI